MKRIKAINGYTIYQSLTARDEENYGCQIGNYNIYQSSDIRDYGLSYSTSEWDDIDSLATCIELCEGSNFAVACAMADEISGSTAQDMDLCLEIERRLDAGESADAIRESFITDEDDDLIYEEYASERCYADDDSSMDPITDFSDLSDNFYTSVALEGSLRQCLISGIGTEDIHDQIESTGLWGMAVLELGHADIEINITHEGDRIFAEYFVCLQEDSGDWFSDGYIDRYVTIDWSAPDWQRQLHDEMRSELENYADKRGWDVTTPFSEEGHVYAEYAAEQCPVEPEPQPAPKQERRSHASYYVIETCDSDCQWLTCTVNRPADLSDDQYRKLFFRKVAERVAFADCGDESIDEIVFDGERVEYVGWQPGMLIEFRSCETGEIVYSNTFPQWDH